MLTQEQLAAALGDRPFRFFLSIGSTNDSALEWLRTGAPTGAIVLADEQTRGRGRLARGWVTPPGSALAVSIILYPPADSLTRLSLLGALAVAEALEEIGTSDVGIKWPNDVQIDRRKACGVLPEAAWDGDHLLGVVLGIGVNVAVDFSGTELAETAISLDAVLGHPVDRLDLLTRLLARIDHWAARLTDPALYDAWRGRLNMLGEAVRVIEIGDRVTEGVAESVDADGALRIRTADGALRRMIVGDAMRGA